MAWSNEETFKFIDLYQSEPAIWNPKNKYHRDKTKINEAWERISEEMDVSVNTLKKKKETLMAAFRLNHKKKLASLKFGISSEVFKPIWIFYERMATFLANVYDDKSGNPNSDNGVSSLSTFQEKWNPVIEVGVEELSDSESYQENLQSLPKKRRHSEMTQENETPHLYDTLITHAMSTMGNIINSLSNKSTNDDDECDIYGKLLAKKLRRLPELQRLELMYEIDTLFIQKRNIKLEPIDVNLDVNIPT